MNYKLGKCTVIARCIRTFSENVAPENLVIRPELKIQILHAWNFTKYERIFYTFKSRENS